MQLTALRVAIRQHMNSPPRVLENHADARRKRPAAQQDDAA